ncbi:MAG TPA: GFA family protein [Steroidobacteraceae bacterium]|nr:GFA family protein [Steroidobacteraceae bacterium]
MPTQGSCLCGAVRYEVDGPFQSMLSCHCSMCRKHHGAPFATFVSAPLAGFRWLSGQDEVQQYPSSQSGSRGFCRVCGSVAPMFIEAMGLVLCPAGNLLGDIGIRPQAHIFVGSKAPWYEITDSLPQHAEFPPEFGMSGLSRPAPTPSPDLIQGSCLCGDVAIEITGKPERMPYCHCSRCRLSRSAAHAANVFMKADQLRWVRGEERVRTYKVPDSRFFTAAFCDHCGSGAPRVVPQFNMAMVPAGMLDTDPGIRVMGHIYVGSKAPWYEITDRVPQYTELWPR